MSAAALIDTLREQSSQFATLRSLLGAPAGQLFVYYICPLSNLRNIARIGILPKIAAPLGRTDLSGQSVQARREILVKLTEWKTAQAHECINLFWNPVNGTLK